MKFQLDLLPREYKSLPRDNFSIGLAFICLMFAVGATIGTYANTARKLKAIDEDWKKVAGGVTEVNTRIGAVEPPTARMADIKKNVDFIRNTLCKKNYSWYEFFEHLERAVPPKRCWISQINKTVKDSNFNFEFIGEAEDNSTVLEFQENLSKTNHFKSVNIRDTQKKVKETQEVIGFVITTLVSE